MSIQKKSLISTLQTTKKANVAAESKGEKQVSAKSSVRFKGVGHANTKGVGGFSARSLKTLKSANNTSLRLMQ